MRNNDDFEAYLAELENLLGNTQQARGSLLKQVRDRANENADAEAAGQDYLPRNYRLEQEQQQRLSRGEDQLQEAKAKALAQLQQRAALLKKPNMRAVEVPTDEFPHTEATTNQYSPAQYYPTGEDLLPLAERIKRSQANSPSMTESPWEAPHASRTEAWKAGLDPRLGAGYMLTTPNLLYDLAEGAVDMVKGTRSPSRWGQAAGALSQAMGGPGTDRFSSPYDKHESAAMLLNPAFYARGAYNKASRTLGPKLREAYFNMRYPHHENVYNPAVSGALSALKPKLLPAPAPQVSHGPGAIARSQQEYFDQELPKINAILEEIMNPRRDLKPQIKGLSPYGEWLDSAENLPMRAGGSV